MSFDLEKFLKSYRPKKENLQHYTKHAKLKGYRRLVRKDFHKLKSGINHIKYIIEGDVDSDKNYGDHIRNAGIFVAGGVYRKRIFTKTEDPREWTHFMIRRTQYEDDKSTEVFRSVTIGGKIFFVK